MRRPAAVCKRATEPNVRAPIVGERIGKRLRETVLPGGVGLGT